MAGQRAIKATPTTTTHYLHDPGGALQAETDGAGTVLREYITLGGATIAIVDAGGVNYVHSDHLATPQVMTDGVAAVVWDASYRPFGEATIAGAAANDQRFPGQTADAETGYHDNWFRTYDPSLGRYLQSDPIGIMAGLNTYAYANGNPVMYADPTGQCPWCVSAGGGAILGFGTEAGIQLYQHGRIVSWSRVGYASGAGALGGLLGYGTRGMGLLGFGIVLGGEGLIGAGYACATGEDPLRGALYGVLGAGVGRVVGKVVGSAGRAGAGNSLIPKAAYTLGQWGEVRLAQVLGGAGFKPTKAFITSLGPRYVDRFVESVAHEVKAGLNVKLTSAIRKQVLKDAELLRVNPAITEVYWHFFQGADQKLLSFLNQNNIKYVLHN